MLYRGPELQGQPTVIVAHTIKGKLFFYGKTAWNGRAPPWKPEEAKGPGQN